MLAALYSKISVYIPCRNGNISIFFPEIVSHHTYNAFLYLSLVVLKLYLASELPEGLGMHNLLGLRPGVSDSVGLGVESGNLLF